MSTRNQKKINQKKKNEFAEEEVFSKRNIIILKIVIDFSLSVINQQAIFYDPRN